MKPKKNTISTASELLSKLSCTTAGEMPFLEDELWNPGDALPEKLRVRWFALRDRKSFQPGDLVTWKPGLQNRIYPKLGAPAIVVQVLETCRHDTEKNSGSTYFNEPLDLILGVVLDDGSHEGDFFTWHFDSRRFMHWKKEN